MMRMMVDATDRHAGNLTATRGLVNATARGMHAASTLPTTMSGRIALTKLVNKFTIRRGVPASYYTTIRSYWRPSEMRFHGIALLASATILGACGGEKTPAADTTAAATPAPAATTTPADTGAAAAAPAAGAPAAGAVAAAPATGQTHEVKMIGDATGYKFDPANLTVKQGDAVKFVMVSGGPHNVTFQNVTDAAAKAQLDANMPGQKMGELAGPMVMQPNEAYVVSFAKVPPGKYDYICTPHAAMNMKGTITVQ